MRLGTIVRCAIVASWLGLFGWHVARRVAPGFGLAERADVGAILGQHLDQSLAYRIRLTGDASRRELGDCQIWFERDEARFRIEHRLRLDDLRPLIGVPARGAAAAGAIAELALIYDDRFRLSQVEGGLTLTGAMALQATYTGVVDHRGLAITYRVDGGAPRTLVVPGIGGDGAQAEVLVPVLPPNLAPGDRYAVPMIDAKRLIATAGADARSRGVVTVEAEETLRTAAGPLSLLRVAIEADGKRESTAWCDRKGTVYRVEMVGTPLIAELTSIRTAGALTWPPQVPSPILSTTPPPPTVAGAER